MISGSLHHVVCPHCGAENDWEAEEGAYIRGDCDECNGSFEVYADFIVQKCARWEPPPGFFDAPKKSE